MSPLAHRFGVLGRRGRDPCMPLRIRRATRREYDALAAFHYRAGPPATSALILGADHARHGVIGVLVVSRPTLNGRWRALAWPGRYHTADRRADAARLNAEVRTISRVIIDPRFRGLGIATRLVRAYLAAPLTSSTEAIAAMGAVCPFFAAAGMTPWRLPPTRHEARLRAALRRAGLPPWRLLEPRRLRAGTAPDLARALRAWADGGRATRPLKHAPPAILARAAAVALSAPLVAYTHERTRTPSPPPRPPRADPEDPWRTMTPAPTRRRPRTRARSTPG